MNIAGFLCAILISPFVLISTLAEDIYITQTASGGNTGVDSTNAHSLTWFNSSANWGAGVNKVSPGDTVHLCGTFTAAAGGTLLNVPASGVTNNVVTIVFEPNAVLEAPYFAQYYGGLRIPDGRHDIKIDGGVNGVIRHTDMGSTNSGKTYRSFSAYGIYIAGCTNIEISNLTITNIFVNTGGDNPNSADDTGKNTAGIQLSHDLRNVSIHNCRVSNARSGIGGGPSGNLWDGLMIYSNVISDNCFSIGIGSGSETNTRVINLDIHDNDISNWTLWQFPGGPHSPVDTYHTDGLILFANSMSVDSYCSGMFRNNYVHGNLGSGSPTAYVSLGCSVRDFYVFNNVFNCETNANVGVWINNSASCAGYAAKTPTNNFILNNTFIGPTNYPKSLGNIAFVVGGTNTLFENNIIYQYYVAFRLDSNLSSDYNILSTDYAKTGTTLSAWRALGYDAHSLTNVNPLLDQAFAPIAGSPAITGGIDLSGLGRSQLSTDKAGNPRGVPWGIGAYVLDGRRLRPPFLLEPSLVPFPIKSR